MRGAQYAMKLNVDLINLINNLFDRSLEKNVVQTLRCFLDRRNMSAYNNFIVVKFFDHFPSMLMMDDLISKSSE